MERPIKALPDRRYDSRTGRLFLKSATPQHFVIYLVDQADDWLLGLSSLTGKAGVIDQRTGKVIWTLPVSAEAGTQNGSISFGSVVYDEKTGRAFVLNNPASANPAAGLENTLITLVVP